ncbi:sodium- and chloride-dependent glycine transporter 1-like isoform X2 [Paramacrobiotus metropolitanus]|uniref:sodium- and chloride-dependent glycine transporter 1-like isoform X2 n=1 Tax=Paramacrobiotus metropolitanus TaxID=2943436 RepID=UPI002445BC2F|nr:sodium- and chloride-dependent glycine transporter 1-like isoform X2 [Paramacrobiotus metropolitanus]
MVDHIFHRRPSKSAQNIVHAYSCDTLNSAFSYPQQRDKDDVHSISAAPNHEKNQQQEERGQWGNKAEFVLSCISLSVGLGNVWRFPYLAYVNGGGAFLIPYICVLFLVGKPMYFLEIALGQYYSQGPVKIWKRIVPVAKGVGVAQVLASLFVAIYYVVIMAWTMYYFWSTLIAACKGEPVPWATFCDNEWAHKPTCIHPGKGENAAEHALTITGYHIPVVMFTNLTSAMSSKMVSSSQQYFDRYVLMKYDKATNSAHSLSNLGAINTEMLGCLAATWVIVFLSLVKGVKSSGKVVYVTSSMPFVVLIILLIRGATLTNAVDGILYFVVPKFDKILSIQTWRAAAEQMFFSLSVAFGSLTMLGSYNKFNNNCYQDALIVSVLDSATSVTAGLAMFSVLGFLAGERGVGVENVIASGPGLAFVTFPEALNQMPVPHLWAILFFIMLFTLGLGSEIGLLENFLTYLFDTFPSWRPKKPYVVGIICTACFLLGIMFITQGGVDLFDIFNEYSGGYSVLFAATLEIICVMWIYGMKRFLNNLREMLGKPGEVSYYWRCAWSALSPVTLLFILVVSLVSYKTLNESSHGHFPLWADAIGWILAGIGILQFPAWAVYVFINTKGDTWKEKFIRSIWPDDRSAPPTPPPQNFNLHTLPRDAFPNENAITDIPISFANYGFQDERTF